MLLVLILLQSFYCAASEDSHWTYDGHEGSHGQERWPEIYRDCGGQAQSPIDIQTDSVRYDPSLLPIETEGYWKTGDDHFTLLNNGHTVQMSLLPNMRLHGLPQAYTAVQLHLHWGRTGHGRGSEHKVDGRDFPAELHVVHFNSQKYASVSKAMSQADGLAVLGVFLEVGDKVNPAYEHILAHLDDIKEPEQETSIPSFDVRGLLPARLAPYFRYNGSLTTPPCYESVLWTIFHQAVPLASSQLEKLQKSLYATKLHHASMGKPLAAPLENNFRHTQPLNGREVFSSVPVEHLGYSAGEITAIVFGVLLACIGLFVAGWIVAKRIREKTLQDQKGVVFTSSSRRTISD